MQSPFLAVQQKQWMIIIIKFDKKFFQQVYYFKWIIKFPTKKGRDIMALSRGCVLPTCAPSSFRVLSHAARRWQPDFAQVFRVTRRVGGWRATPTRRVAIYCSLPLFSVYIRSASFSNPAAYSFCSVAGVFFFIYLNRPSAVCGVKLPTPKVEKNNNEAFNAKCVTIAGKSSVS